jgi:hypothetical protein
VRANLSNSAVTLPDAAGACVHLSGTAIGAPASAAVWIA